MRKEALGDSPTEIVPRATTWRTRWIIGFCQVADRWSSSAWGLVPKPELA